MDFLNPSKKRSKKIKLIVGYVLIAIAIALVTLILVFQSYGYDLDRKTGAIIQNGLLVVSSQPEPADVYLNGKQYKSQAGVRIGSPPTSLVLPSDIYKLELIRSGYHTWSKTISLAGGTIERVVYPFLFPTDLKAKVQKSYAAMPDFSTQSPDRHWLLVQQPGLLGVFDQYDANDSKKAPTIVTVPAEVFTASTSHQLTTIEWSTDNKHVLVRHNFAGGQEFVVIDRDTPASSYNVNKALKVAPTKVAMRDKHFDQLYVYDQTTKKLDFGDVRDSTVKPVLANVLDFKSHGGDQIVYASDELATAGKTRIMMKDDSGSYLLREVSVSPTYLLDMAQYSGHWYVAVGAVSESRVYVYKDPLAIIKTAGAKISPESVLRATNPGWIGFSANTQFVAIQGGSQVSLFDAENARTYKYDLKIALDPTAPNASWMDGDRLIFNSQGQMVVVDYDGLNIHTLVPNQPGLLPYFDREYKLMYNVAPAATGAALNRYNLVVGQNN